MEQPVVFDNTVLVNFSLVGRPSLIHEAWPHSSCTTAWVLQEYSRGVEEGILPAFKWDRLHPADLEEDEITFAGRLSDSLGRGERSALAVAYHRNGLFASDDADARREAHVYDIPVTGTIGVLVRLVRREVISIDRG